MNTTSLRIFISHSSKDHQFCLQLVEGLRSVLGDADAVWYDAHGGLHGGDAWWRTIEQELATRNVFIVVLSPEAITSNWVNDEIDIAWSRKNDPDLTKKMRLFPILLQPCEIRPGLRSLQIISFVYPKTFETAFEELLLALGLATSTSMNPATQQVPLTAHKDKYGWYIAGVNHMKAQQFEQAIADFSHAIDLDPQDAWAHLFRGHAYFALKQYQQAIADFGRAIDLDPKYVDAYINRGAAYANLKQYQQAIADFDRAIDLDPQDAAAYSNRGQAYHRLGENEEAIADYDRAIQLDPQYQDAYYNRGQLYYDLHEYQKAIADYDRALQIKDDARIKFSRMAASSMLP